MGLPELSGKRDAGLDPDSSTRFHITRAAFEPIALDNQNADVIPYTSAYVANSHLIECLGRAVGRPLNDSWHNVGAFHFPPDQLSDLQTVLENHAQEFNATSALVVAKLKQAIQEAEAKDQSLVFSKDHASLSLEEREEFLDRELNHVRQRLLARMSHRATAWRENSVPGSFFGDVMVGGPVCERYKWASGVLE